MTKQEFMSYISVDNPGFYKTRRVHINKRFPEILQEIEQHISTHNLTPINFNDAVYYYIDDCVTQQKCTCEKIIGLKSLYCSNKCKKDNIQVTLDKTRNTLKERYGEDSPLKISQFKKKFENTCVDRFGETHPAKNKEIAQKIKDTNMETYKDPNLRKTISINIKKAYENDGANILEKRKQTNFENTGEYKTLTSASIKKAKDTLVDKYGTNNPFTIHEDTYKKAGESSIKFYNNTINKDIAIQTRINSIIDKYGSLEEMNKIVFGKKKENILANIKVGVVDDIIEYTYDNLGFVKCECNKCKEKYDISLRLLKERSKRNDITCTICSPPINKSTSNVEIELYNWIRNFIDCERNNRKILDGKEVDIYIPNKNIGVEFNGIYWHSDLYKDKNYHLNKTLFLKNKNISLIHVWEDLWNIKKEIVKGRILSKLGMNHISIGARKTLLKEISSKEANEFYEQNHLQGKTRASNYIGLYYNDELISSLSFGKRRIGRNNENNYEILRFCNKIGINCVGSFSKMFKYVKNNYNGDYISYADLSWGEGSVYEKAGFKLLEYSKPNYWYFIENKRYHRYTFNKQNLIKAGYNKDKTEFQIMDEIGALRVYDCGNAVWKYKN